MKTYLRKSLLTIATLLLAAVTVSAEPKDVEYVLSTQTYVDNTNDSVWNFKNDFTISNEKGKTYGTGKENGFKFSAGVQYTILLPDGRTGSGSTGINRPGRSIGCRNFLFFLVKSEEIPNEHLFDFHMTLPHDRDGRFLKAGRF